MLCGNDLRRAKQNIPERIRTSNFRLRRPWRSSLFSGVSQVVMRSTPTSCIHKWRRTRITLSARILGVFRGFISSSRTLSGRGAFGDIIVPLAFNSMMTLWWTRRSHSPSNGSGPTTRTDVARQADGDRRYGWFGGRAQETGHDWRQSQTATTLFVRSCGVYSCDLAKRA
jgi:hypothetical protein